MSKAGDLQALLRALQPLQTSLDELKLSADRLLEEYGLPTQPSCAIPPPRVRVRLLQDLTLPAGPRKKRTRQAGEEVVMEQARFESERDRGKVESIGPAPALPAAIPLPFADSGLAPYFDWFQVLSAGEVPAEWVARGIEIAPEKRAGVLAALWNAALVYRVDAEVKMAVSVAIQARHGSALVAVEEALLWPTQALVTLLQQFPSEKAAKFWQTRQDNRIAGKSPKYARGIQAAVDHSLS